MSATTPATPPSQLWYVRGNLIDVRVHSTQVLTALSRGELTLDHLAMFGTALNDTTTSLRWLLDHPDAPQAHDLVEELTLPEFK
ncbi:hypothetical protein [Actinokineospora spheciospongiae]|uniref:hypothetical protein n=1 Tax=Actinokineospora spheciospongiae TaxID=909613 RepID=UPI000D70B160|nr:hypothetical protein [Actinokineospora spheciospongiae]PWW58399.1 hypothetical protein DFQ13_109192 [Actinokineospora spheciospongiae]